MEYYFAKTINENFEAAIEKVTEALKSEGFGILTEIDLKATLKKKLDVDFYAFSAHKMYGPNGVGILYGYQNLVKTFRKCQQLQFW